MGTPGPVVLNPALASMRDSVFSARTRAEAAGAMKNNVPSWLVGESMLQGAEQVPVGSLTHAGPDADAAADIARGREVLSALGPFDIGQAVVVIDGHVVAVEDIEGTDALLTRIAHLREQGRIRAAPL